jgi:dihydrofolate reductase
MKGDVFGDKMNSMPKYVVSSTLESADWENSTVIDGGNAMEQIAELKPQVDGDILVAGSGQLVRGLTEAGLVDEFHLMVFPVVLGTGRRLFDGTSPPAKLRLLGTQEAGDALILTYVPR